MKHFDGTGWVPVADGKAITNPYPGGATIKYSLAIDNNNNVYIAGMGTDTKLTVYKCNLTSGAGWDVVGSPDFARTGGLGYINMAIDKTSGTPYVVYDDNSIKSTPTGGLYGSVKKFDGTNWVYVGKSGFTLGSAGIFSADIAIDPQGNPICSFQDDNGFQRASVFKYSNGNWQPLGHPNFSQSTAYPVKVALDLKGKPYVSFIDVSYNNKGTIMTYNNANNTWDVVGARGFWDIGNNLQRGSIFVDGYDNPWLAGQYDQVSGYISPVLFEFLPNDSTILPARPAVQVANRQNPDTTGWTHYYYDNGTPDDFRDDILLLSLKTTENIGNIGDGTFMVRSVATAGAGGGTGIKLTNPLVTNTTGYWAMNRYWQVTPTKEPTNSVGVRFYYNNQDLADVNGSYPAHNLTNQKLIFYKCENGNPDPTANVAGATRLISILANSYASDTSWLYRQLTDTTQYAEYSVSSFSGGGGGATGDGKKITASTLAVLPITFLNFNGNRHGNYNLLQWTTSNEVGTKNFLLESSANGSGFSSIGNVVATGGGNYAYTDINPFGTRTYYRLKIIDADGRFSYSSIIWINKVTTNSITVYPNPVAQTTTLNIDDNIGLLGTQAQLTNAEGKIIKLITIAHNQEQIDMALFPAGLYVLKLKDGSVVKVMKH